MDSYQCSFCGKSRLDVKHLISGKQAIICDECLSRCNEILFLAHSQEKFLTPTPQDIYQALDDACVGQKTAKQVLAVGVYNHYKRIKISKKSNDVELEKGNILLVGPTGCGKTLLVQTLASYLDVPFAVADATTLTSAGYVGEDVESVIKSLMRNANGDIEKAQQGIVFIDEIDKIARKGGGPNGMRDVGGEGVQQALLKMLEGKIVNVPLESSKGRPSETIQIDTRNILFVCSGAFAGLNELVEKRVLSNKIGFGPNTSLESKHLLNWAYHLLPEDFLRFGMIPEFIGRLPIVATCEALSLQELEEVLYRPKNALLKQYQTLFAIEGVQLEFTPDCISAIAQESIRRSLGARGLRSILEKIMLDLMYDLPSMDGIYKCTITKEAVTGSKGVILNQLEQAYSSS